MDTNVSWEEKLDWFRDLYGMNYSSVITNPNARVLEVGCNQGFFLKVLSEQGFKNLYGIDLSPEDVEIAKTKGGLANVFVADLHQFLCNSPLKFDVILAKDVLEHVEKSQLLSFVTTIKDALAPGGLVLFQVPNMDWLYSSHERFMDLTHEVGFTPQSLGQLLRLHFHQVEIRKVSYLFPKNWKQRLLWGPFRKLYLSGLRFHLKVMGEGASELWFDCREILGIGRNQP
ncbi:MAG: class I SAM-dependent methyltransferase [Terriglobia bacterium]